MKKLVLALCFWWMINHLPFYATAQIQLKVDYLNSSTFKDKQGEKYGSGNMLRLSGRYYIPLGTKVHENNKLIIWNSSVSASYAKLQNKDIENDINPSEILNINYTVNNIRPIAEKWSLVSSLGLGIYSAPNDISYHSILLNGAVIFVYQLQDNLNIGIGAGLTNSFGIPLLLPMSVISWKLSGSYEVQANISSGIDIAAAKKLNNNWRIKLVAIEIDGMSAVMRQEDKSKIYGLTNMRSYLSPEYKTGKSTLFASVGGNWLRSVNG